jgi:hypothetical protein
MKLWLIVVTLPLTGSAQAVCKKIPGDNGSFTWKFLVSDEAKINGFRWYSSPLSTGPFNNLVGSAAASARTMQAPVTFSTGTVKTYYVVRSYFTSAGGTVESTDASPVVECEMSVPTPTVPQVQ